MNRNMSHTGKVMLSNVQKPASSFQTLSTLTCRKLFKLGDSVHIALVSLVLQLGVLDVLPYLLCDFSTGDRPALMIAAKSSDGGSGFMNPTLDFASFEAFVLIAGVFSATELRINQYKGQKAILSRSASSSEHFGSVALIAVDSIELSSSEAPWPQICRVFVWL